MDKRILACWRIMWEECSRSKLWCYNIQSSSLVILSTLRLVIRCALNKGMKTYFNSNAMTYPPIAKFDGFDDKSHTWLWMTITKCIVMWTIGIPFLWQYSNSAIAFYSKSCIRNKVCFWLVHATQNTASPTLPCRASSPSPANLQPMLNMMACVVAASASYGVCKVPGVICPSVCKMEAGSNELSDIVVCVRE